MDLRSRLSYLFGTEEYVDMRRQLVLLRDKLKNDDNEQIRYICSGSLGEGVAYPSSDDDEMIHFTIFRVVKSYTDISKAYDVIPVPSIHSPGYCMLHDVTHSYPKSLIHVIKGMSFVSSSQWKLQLIEERESMHGPCQSQIIGSYEYDRARCIPCSFWPDVANEWVIRNRSHGWPSQDLIHRVKEQGCYMVPIGHIDSPYSHHEWRISFSLAERALMHSLNHVQFLTYNLLRLCLKRVIERTFPDVICSYFVKTSLFYTLENTSKYVLQVDCVETGFKACLSVLYDFVDHRYCPNYFIPEYNMMKRKVNHSNRDGLLKIIRTLYNIGVIGTIRLCGESKCLNDNLSLNMIEYKLDNELMLSSHISFTMMYLPFWIFKQSHAETVQNFLLYKIIDMIKCSSTVLQNFVIGRGINHCSNRLSNYALSFNRINRCNYPLYKTIEALLRIGYRIDVTTGQLTTAAYMYMVGRTESALSHLHRLLSEYPPYAMDSVHNEMKKSNYMDVMCRKYTIDCRVRHAHAPRYGLHKYFLNAFPLPIRMWIFLSDIVLIDPLSYAYFLEILCYIRLQSHTALIKSTRCLVNHVGDLKNKYDIAGASMCIGIIKYEQGDD